MTPPTTHIAVFTYEIAVVNGTDYDKLQVALSALCAWAEDWQLSISISKCCVLHIGKGNVSHQFFINGSPLPVINSSRDLGITITSTLLFADHITNIVAKAHQRANTIHRCFRNTTLLVRTFVTYVRPLLECNSVIWSPHHKGDTLSIEQVQRRFTKRLLGLRDLSYEKRLSVLNLQSLELRRLHFDLIWCYKILFGLVCVNFDEFFQT